MQMLITTDLLRQQHALDLSFICLFIELAKTGSAVLLAAERRASVFLLSLVGVCSKVFFFFFEGNKHTQKKKTILSKKQGETTRSWKRRAKKALIYYLKKKCRAISRKPTIYADTIYACEAK